MDRAVSETNTSVLDDDVQTEQLSPKDKIIPTIGGLTRQYISIFGANPSKIENLKDRQVSMIFDGLKLADESYELKMRYGYFYATAAETLFSKDYPSVGLKIHVVLDPDDSSYSDKLLEIAQLCLGGASHRPTTFKVRLYSDYKHRLEWDPDDARKVVTIYPNYVEGERTNVAETTRLVAELRQIMGEGMSENEDGINSEHRSGKGIYLRPGAFTEEGRSFEKAFVDDPFEGQMRENLDSPFTDAELFIRQIEEAINSRQL